MQLWIQESNTVEPLATQLLFYMRIKLVLATAYLLLWRDLSLLLNSVISHVILAFSGSETLLVLQIVQPHTSKLHTVGFFSACLHVKIQSFSTNLRRNAIQNASLHFRPSLLKLLKFATMRFQFLYPKRQKCRVPLQTCKVKVIWQAEEWRQQVQWILAAQALRCWLDFRQCYNIFDIWRSIILQRCKCCFWSRQEIQSLWDLILIFQNQLRKNWMITGLLMSLKNTISTRISWITFGISWWHCWSLWWLLGFCLW